MDNSTTQNNELVSAVGRTMAVLEALAEHPEESGVSEIAQKLDMSKSTVYRFLQSLKARGYVVQDAEDRYRLSVRLFELGAQALPHLDIVREAEPGMRRINELTGETVHLGILDEGSIVYVHKIDSKYNLRMYSRIGRRAPLYCTGIGKVLMAWLEDHFAEDVCWEEVAAQFSLSLRTLHRQLKQQTGLTPQRYLNRVRLMKARHLLRHSDDSVTDIAYRCGFGDSNHFSTLFRREFSWSPRDIRQGRDAILQ